MRFRTGTEDEPIHAMSLELNNLSLKISGSGYNGRKRILTKTGINGVQSMSRTLFASA